MSSEDSGPASADTGRPAATGHARAPRRFRSALWLWGPAVVYIAAVFTVSSIPIRKAPSIWKFQDKAAHFTEYAVLAALLVRALGPKGPARAAAAAFAVSLVLAGVDELHQGLVPGRSPELLDAVSDAVGALLGAITGAALLALFGRRAARARAAGNREGGIP